jgi:alpha-glucuronidase
VFGVETRLPGRGATFILRRLCLLAVGLSLCLPVAAETGYDLWLRYQPLPVETIDRADGHFQQIVTTRESPTIDAAVRELRRGLNGMLGRNIGAQAGSAATGTATASDAPAAAGARALAGSLDGAVILGTPDSLEALSVRIELRANSPDAFVVTTRTIDGQSATVIAGNSDVAQLYGAFALLRHLAVAGDPAQIDLESAPRIQHRLLNHWDNLDRSVERGYAGQSLWDWTTLPEYRDRRYTDYARANASIGVNGTVLNNVNARADSLTAPYIGKAAALADQFRPYGIRVYLSARFSAPIDIGGLETSDPLDPAVRRFWRDKAAEIYAAIPDFGGFLVKANSEGQPGPQDFGRTHADGANMLAEAVAPYDGIVMWRAFVYSDTNPEDRAKQAYDEFMPLDGEFADNVIIQVKNGPIDFQPREPFHPLFGAMTRTPLMVEFQVTKEYLGFASHFVYLAPLYQEVLAADTSMQGPGSTVARVADGSLYGSELTAMAGVANTGTDLDWTGSTFNQANWYAFGRLAWDPELTARLIANEWLPQTFTVDPSFIEAATELMLLSREAPVNYMTPLGLAHLMATGHHYGPGPWVSNLERPEWNPVYYHQADADGIGFDRTATGSDAVSQYADPVAARFADPDRVGDELLLWFHRVPWTYRMAGGETLWEALVGRYDLGVAQVEDMQQRWAALEAYVDEPRFAKTAELLQVQLREARWWRDACISFFRSVSGLPLPEGVEPPEHPLEYYMQIDNRYAPG